MPHTITTTEHQVARPRTGERREADSYEDAVRVAQEWVKNYDGAIQPDELVIETRVVTATNWEELS